MPTRTACYKLQFPAASFAFTVNIRRTAAATSVLLRDELGSTGNTDGYVMKRYIKAQSWHCALPPNWKSVK